jgi:hypothetical protein
MDIDRAVGQGRVWVMCNQCGKDATKQCPRCRLAYYCDRECQKADWAQHKSICGTPTDAAVRGAECVTHWYRTVFYHQHYTSLAQEARRRNDTIVVHVQVDGARSTLNILTTPWREHLRNLVIKGHNVGDRESATRALSIVDSQSAIWIIMDMRTVVDDVNVSATQVVWVADMEPVADIPSPTYTDIHSLD